MTKKPLLPLCLTLLMALSAWPAVGHASGRALPPASSPLPSMAGPAASQPAPSCADRTPISSAGQSPETSSSLHFDRLSAADGLSFSLATCILQDRQGFMWFGTRYGLNKYDGFNFTVYALQSSGDVLDGNYVQELYQDRTGDLWIATRADLVRRDHKTGELVHYRADLTHPQLGVGQILTIGEDSAEALWIGTSSGLMRYDRAADTFTRFLGDQAILEILVDRQGGTWLGTGSGLRHYAAGLQEEELAYYRHDRSDPTSLSSDGVNAVHEDHQGVLWVGTWTGLNRLDRSTGRFTRYYSDPTDPYSLSDNAVTCILEDDLGRLWVGTGNGLNLLDRTTGRCVCYHFNPDDPHSLSNDTVLDLYQDHSGVVWVATLAGICKLNETASCFKHYQQGPSQPNLAEGTLPGSTSGLSDNVVETVYQDSQGILWIGTVTGGLNRLDPSTSVLTVYRRDPADLNSLSHDEVAAIYEDRAGRLWIGSSGGLDRFNPVWETFASEAVFRGRGVTSIVEDAQGNLWVGYSGGFLRREPGALTFTPVPLVGSPVAPGGVRAIYPDRTGCIWISSEGNGLFRLDPGTAQGVSGTSGGLGLSVVHFPQDSNDPKSPGAGPMMGFYEDADGTLWMGSMQDGLIRFDRDSQKFTHYMPGTGQAAYVSNVQADSRGFLWMGTKLGLARFDPRTETFSYFDARDGLVIGEVLTGCQSKQGEMFFGGMQGLNAFFPDQIRDNPSPPAVVITALNLRNQVLRTDLPADDHITLSYRENYLSFDFAALDFTAPDKNQYAYRMEGLEADWVEAGTRRHADYPDLKPGAYTFRVKASNNSGVWNEQGAALRITITPPLWQTGWFLGLLGVALLGAIAAGMRLRLRSAEARSRELEKQVSERTGALEQKTFELQQRTQETERRRQELQALLTADDRMQRYLQQDQVLQALVDVAVDNLHADKSAVFWWDEQRERLSMRVARGWRILSRPDAVCRGWWQQALSQLQFAPGEGVVGAAALNAEPVWVGDCLSDPRCSLENPQLVKTFLDEGVHSLLFLPITLGKQVLGVFNVSFVKPHAAGPEEQRLFQALTQRAALYIENARLYEQSQELAVLEERSRLARELHDAVTQTLFSASLVAEALPTTWERDPQEGRGLLQELRGLSRGALAEMRTLLLELRPAALVETRLEDLLRQLGEAASGRAGIPVHVQVEGQAELPPDVRIAFYRITQEALNNVVKHSRAHQASVRLGYAREGRAAAPIGTVESGPGVLLSIQDDGRGFDPTQLPHNRLGLGIMQERAQAIGARLSVESQPGHGTQVSVLWKPQGKQEAR